MAVEENSTRSSIDRRTALKRMGTIAVAGTAGLAGLQFFSRPVFAIDAETFTADDVSISSKNGKINDIWLKPDLTYSWDGLDSNPESVEFTMSIENPALDGTVEKIGSETDTDPTQALAGESGEYTFEDRLSLITDGPWSTGDFRAMGSKSPKTVGPIGVTVEGTLTTAEGETFTDSKTDAFSVTTNNQKVSFGAGSEGDATGGGVGGVAGTGGN